MRALGIYTSTSFMRYRPIIITIISLSLTSSPPFGRLASTITQQHNHHVAVVVVVGWVMVERVVQYKSSAQYPTNQQLPQQQSIIYNNQQQQPHRAKHHGRHCIIQSVFSEAFVAAPSNPSCSSPACHGVFLDLRHANPSLMTLH